MGKKITLTESKFKRMVDNVLSESEGEYNIKGVYHVSNELFDEFKITDYGFDYFFFSSEPIHLSNKKTKYLCNLSMHKPMTFKCGGTSWGYPLWLYLSDREGNLIKEEEFTRERYDGYLGCPFEFWEAVYYDDDEYSVDLTPQIVKGLNMGYDGVIIEDIGEGETPNHYVTDYVVFKPSQIQIVKRF